MNDNIKNLQWLNARANQIGKRFFQRIAKTVDINNQMYELLRINNCEYNVRRNGDAKNTIKCQTSSKLKCSE